MKLMKRLLPLLEFGREREGVDLSKIRLTHHALRDKSQQHDGGHHQDGRQVPDLRLNAFEVEGSFQ